MIPLILLIAVTLIAFLILRYLKGKYDFAGSARVGMTAMLIFTAVGHFIFAEGMAMMIPDIFPFKKGIVYFTAFFEIAAAIGLQLPRYRKITAWLLILFFILVLPANIKAAMEQVDYQNASFTGPGLSYLWFRIPLQIVFIAWVYFSSLRNS